jgi:hypothetical protein
VREPLLGRLEHRRGSVDADDLADERRQGLGDLAGAAPEVGDDGGFVQKAEKRGEEEAPSEQIVAELIPLRGARAEELLGSRAPRRQDLGQAALVLLRREGPRRFLPRGAARRAARPRWRSAGWFRPRGR